MKTNQFPLSDSLKVNSEKACSSDNEEAIVPNCNYLPISLIKDRLLSLPAKIKFKIFNILNTLFIGTLWDKEAQEIWYLIMEEERAYEAAERMKPTIHQTNIQEFNNQAGAAFIDLENCRIDIELLGKIIAEQEKEILLTKSKNPQQGSVVPEQENEFIEHGKPFLNRGE